MNTFEVIVIGAALLALTLLGNFACAAIPGEGRAKSAVENLGFHDVRVTGRQPAFEVLGGCKTDDVTKFTVVGLDAAEHAHTIQVCAPIIGGYTIRN